jgi:dTDP-4-dehydrorhamnose 3,5-epimerase
MAQLNLICEFCGKKFKRYVSPARLKEGRGRFCSRKCFSTWQRRRIKITCIVCGRTKELPVSLGKNAKFCSVTCKADAQSVGIGGRGGKSATTIRAKFRKDLATQNPYICQIHGCYEPLVDAAHRVARKNNGPDTTDNGMFLCPIHHKKYDMGITPLSWVDAMSVRYIHGLETRKPHKLWDDRGWLMEIIRNDDIDFTRWFPNGFQQLYVTAVKHNVVKAWHMHKKQHDHMCCLVGRAKLILYDARRDSVTRGLCNTFILTPEVPLIIRIPPGVWHGFKGIWPEESLIMNMPTYLYDPITPDENRLPAHTFEIPYSWDTQDR